MFFYKFGIPNDKIRMPHEVTELLLRFSQGDPAAINDIYPLIYSELKKIANNYLRKERAGHTLQPTALVHEAYLKLIDVTRIDWQNRAHFLAMASTMMRQILVDHARLHRANKRGSGRENESLEDQLNIVADKKQMDLIRLDEALNEFEKFDPVKSRLVELRYFGGLSVEETAGVLGVSGITVKRHWQIAKAWLAAEIKG